MEWNKSKVIESTLEEVLHACNVLDMDFEMGPFDDDLTGVTVTPPVRMTAEGRAYWAKALGARVVTDYSGAGEKGLSAEIGIADGPADVDALQLLEALNGFCTKENYGRWFEGDDARLI